MVVDNSVSNSDDSDCQPWSVFFADPKQRKRGFNLALRKLGDRSEAEDAVQEACYRICKYSTDDVKDKPNFFLKTVQNVCIDRCNDKSRIIIRTAVPVDGPATEEDKEARMEFPDPALTPDKNAERNEEDRMQHRLLDIACKNLNSRERELLALHFRDLSNEEIAHQLGVDVKVIRVAMNAVLAKIRHRLKRLNND